MRLLLLLAVASASLLKIKAEISVAVPLSSQLPQIAHVGTPYTWSIGDDTFLYSALDASSIQDFTALSYNATGLPAWVQFDGPSGTFSGTPQSTDKGSVEVTVTANMAAVSLDVGGSISASSSFTLLTLQEPAPVLSLPLAQQLLDPEENSLGPKSVLSPGNILHIPPGWSFSMGFSGDTFTQQDENQVYMAASINGSTDLPSWLTWSADTYTLYGVASVEGTFDVVMTGSNRQGFGGVTDFFTIQVSAHTLSLGTTLRSVNASVGNMITYRIPSTGLVMDNRQNNNVTDPVNVSVNLATLPWLTFDQASASISGVPPFEQYGNATSMQVALLPVVYGDTYGNNVAANLTINIAPYGFTVQMIPNLVVAANKEIYLSLSQYVRNITSSASLAVVNDTTNATSSTSPAITANFDPANSTEFLNFDADTLTLSGTMPSDLNTRVKVNLEVTNSDNQKSSASLYVETPAASANSSNSSSSSSSGDSGIGSNSEKKHSTGSSGLSHRAKIALGVSLGAVGGLLALILLMICCRRHIAKEEHNHRGYIHDDHDERTLTDTSSPSRFKKAIVIRRPQETLTPNTLTASPYFDHEKQAGLSKEPALASVMVEDPSGEKRDATHEADEPMQSRLMNNLFGGKKNTATVASNNIEANAGLGLALNLDDPYSSMGAAMTNSKSQGGIGNFQSEHSMRTHRSSWESDLFYEDASVAPPLPIHNSLTVSNSTDDVPRRRGATGNDLTVRHRNTHHNASPAFNTPGIFTPPDDLAGSQDSLTKHNDDDYLSETYGSADQLSGRALEEAQIMEAKVLQVRKHSPMIHTNGNPFSQTKSHSAETEDNVNNEAFDDAEWEDESEGHSVDVATRRPQYNQRMSTMSAMTDSSQLQTIRAHYAREEVIPAAPLRQPEVFSPNPSFMDGASISGFEPQETMRAISIPSRPRTPPNPFARHQHSSSNASRPKSVNSTASRFLSCPCVAAIVNYPVRFHIYPTIPPPMAGAPGSPGKRSGEGVRYSLIVDDARPHLLPFRLTWPDMLGDWLTFNDATFEAFGIVPNNAGLEDLGDVEIALIAIKRTVKVPPSPKGSPTRRHHKRSSTLSFDSSHTVIPEDDITVVARVKLVFQAGPQVY